jgi:hypothetical protein
MSQKIELFLNNLRDIIIQKKKYKKMILDNVYENNLKYKKLNNILVSNLNTTIHNLLIENKLLNDKITNFNNIYIFQVNNLIEKTKTKFEKCNTILNKDDITDNKKNEKIMRTMNKMITTLNKYNNEVFPYVEKLIYEKENIDLNEINEKIKKIIEKY